MNMKWARVWLCWVACGVTARSEPNEAKRPLEGATVFAGPEGGGGEIPAEKAGKVPAVPDAAAFWKRHGELKAAVAGAKGPVIYEGWPQGPKGKGHLSAEQKKALVMIDGEPFYPTAQTMAPEWAERLRTTVFAAVREWSGIKLCGGFHADFLLKWDGEAGEVDAMICFGCQEIRLFGPTGELYGNLTNDGAKELRELLAPFWKRKNAVGQREPMPTPPARR